MSENSHMVRLVGTVVSAFIFGVAIGYALLPSPECKKPAAPTPPPPVTCFKHTVKSINSIQYNQAVMTLDNGQSVVTNRSYVTVGGTWFVDAYGAQCEP